MGFCFWLNVGTTVALTLLTSQRGTDSARTPSGAEMPPKREVATRLVILQVPAQYYESLDRHTHSGVRARVDRGGAILGPKDLQRFMKSVQSNDRTHVMATPLLVAETGHAASFCSAPLTCEAVPTWVGPDQSVHLKISGVVQKPDESGAEEEEDEDEPAHAEEASFRVSAVVPQEGAVLFGGWKCHSEGRDQEMVILLLAEAGSRP
jgi:hypothetical protein